MMKKGISRRNFFKVAAASGATTALVGCTKDPIETMIPMLTPPADYLPGKAIYFATTSEDHGDMGIVVKTREGRAIKVEGNPDHPLSQGSANASVQATLQGLYNPARIPMPVEVVNGKKQVLSWEKAEQKLIEKIKDSKGSILYIGKRRTGNLRKLTNNLFKQLQGEAISLDLLPVRSILSANEAMFEAYEIPEIQLEKADFLLNFGADFLESWLYTEKFSREFSKMHSYHAGNKGTYVHVGTHISQTASNADKWLACPVGAETQVALCLASIILPYSKVDLPNKEELLSFLSSYSALHVQQETGIDHKKLEQLAHSLLQAQSPIVIAGGNATTEDAKNLQLVVNLLNYMLGNINEKIVFGAGYDLQASLMQEVETAFNKMQQGKYKLVIIENVNPLYALPKSMKIEQALAKVEYLVSFSTELDETTQKAHLQMPTSHFLESWGDSFPRKGIYSLQQPVMAKVPGYNTKSLGDLLLSIAQKTDSLPGREEKNYKEYLKTEWHVLQKTLNQVDFDTFWNTALQKGGFFEKPKVQQVTLNVKPILAMKVKKLKNDSIQLIAVNTTFHNANGFNGNKPWLLEAPNPLTQLVWDSWVEMNVHTAKKLGVTHGCLVEIKTEQGQLQVGAWIHEGVADNTLIMPTGLGRNVPFPNYISTRNKSLLLPHIESKKDLNVTYRKIGVNPIDIFSFQANMSGDFIYSLPVKATGLKEKSYMVSVNGTWHKDIVEPQRNTPAGMPDRSQKQRGLVQTVNLSELSQYNQKDNEKEHIRYFTTDRQKNTDLYNKIDKNVRLAQEEKGATDETAYYKKYKFEMIVDLDKCTGCSACVVACQAENNVPVVGKDHIATGREMQWIRIERFIETDKKTGDIQVQFTPEMCSQCDNAGCETVCPVYATYHTPDGINAMIYNRCVGTRYCANNCAYKQRHFNWRTYEFPKPLHFQLNPDISIREKGVMEKCDFCSSRVRERKALAKEQGREVLDGEIQLACQQACSTGAIIFGNKNDIYSNLNQTLSETKRAYKQLEELNFKPSITYLKKVNRDKIKV